jgi:hypothetical protein
MNIKTKEFSAGVKLNRGKRHSLIGFSDQGTEGDVEEGELSEEDTDTSTKNKNSCQLIMTLVPDLMPTTTMKAVGKTDAAPRIIDIGTTYISANDSPKRRKTNIDEAALFNT